jgi:hypothetical protein|tara:strand:- start:4760 stop:6895 length:2136 start_codon:yes stop_codon:yes gene_type:complete
MRSWIVAGILWVGLGVVGSPEVLCAKGKIQWRSAETQRISLRREQIPDLRSALSTLLRTHAKHPQRIVLHSEVQGPMQVGFVEGGSPEAVLSYLLSQHGLSVVNQAEQTLILPRKLVWKYQPIQRPLASPVPLQALLDELSEIGELSIEYVPEALRSHKVHRSLAHESVSEALTQLAREHSAFLEYFPGIHRMRWVQSPEMAIRTLRLRNQRGATVAAEWSRITASLLELRQVEFVNPVDQLIVLKGPEPWAGVAEELVRQLDVVSEVTVAEIPQETSAAASPPESVRTLVLESVSPELLESRLAPLVGEGSALAGRVRVSWGKEAAEDGKLIVALSGEPKAVTAVAEVLLELEPWLDESPPTTSTPKQPLEPQATERQVLRIPLRYLHIGDRKVRSNGEIVTLKGADTRLHELLEKEFPAGSSEERPALIPDRPGNALVLIGLADTLQFLQQLLKVWDQPRPLIRIEAHIFETSEEFSRRLGVEFSARGAPISGTPNVDAPGAFSAAGVLGGAETSRGYRVDTVLRLMQQEGKGRILSRPLVVTGNDLEAEMISGSLINVKLLVGKGLRELRTGVTLRVTPRLIADGGDNRSRDRIWLNVYAETSTPILSHTVDGIPQINVQRTQGSVEVSNGQPFLLGGLIKDSTGSSESGVPFFKDLPLLGWLFRTNANERRFDHVMVFITPTRIVPESSPALPDFGLERGESTNFSE